MMSRLSLPLFCLLFVCASCKQDNYDSGEGELSMLTADFAVIEVSGDTLVRSATTDDNRSLTLTAPTRPNWVNRPDTAYRALFYYKTTNGASGAVEPYGMQRVAVATPLRPERFTEGVKQDPMTLESLWMSKNRRWVNLSLLLKVGATDDADAGHILGFVRDTLLRRPLAVGSTDSLSTLCLRLHHEQNKVPDHYTQRVYVSLPTASLEGADTLRLSLNTSDGLVVKTLSLR